MTTLGEVIAEGPTNGYSATSNGDAAGPLTLKLSATTAGVMRLDETTVKRVVEQIPDDSKLWLEPGDLLIQRANTLNYVGASAIFEGPSRTYIYPDLMMRVRIPSADLRHYVWRYLNSPEARKFFQSKATGTAGNMPKINGEAVRSLPLPLPPANEQCRIIARLEALVAQSHRAKEALDDVPALLERFRQSVLATAFRGDLTQDWREKNPDTEPASKLLERIRAERRHHWEEAELDRMKTQGKAPKDGRWKEKYQEPEEMLLGLGIPDLPESWCWAASAEVVDPDAEIVYGIVQPGPEVADGVPYVRGMDIGRGQILEHQLRRTSRKIAERYERASLRGGDVLLGIIRATKVAIVPNTLNGANITQGTARFRPVRGLGTQYLAGWLESPEAQDRLHLMYRGIDMPGLNLRDVRRLPVPLAPEQEQLEIARRLWGFRAIENRISGMVEAMRARMSQLEPALLGKAFRGEIVPQDPTDEPASVLLERIRADRDRSETAEPPPPAKRRRETKVA